MGATNCPETPRQRMISMMYLVLTAMLALNVSKDILNAFIIVNDTMEQTNTNFTSKVENSYALFQSTAEKQEKVKPFYEKAKQVQKISNEMVQYMEQIKKELFSKVDGKTMKEIEGKSLKDMEARDNYDIPSEYFIGQKSGKGKALEMKAKIEAYKKELQKIVGDDKFPKLIEKSLVTNEKYKNANGENETWEVHNFEHMVAAACYTIVNKLIGEIKNTEYTTVSYLFSAVDAESFKFDKVGAKVIPNSRIVFSGDSYEADIIVAAIDTRQNPSIYWGQGRESASAADINSLTLVQGDSGFVHLKIPTGGIGNQKYAGVIKLISPDGEEKYYPFSESYTVTKPSAAIAADKMNVFYAGIPNPVSIAAPVAPEQLRINWGGLTSAQKGGGKYEVTPDKGFIGKKVTISVSADLGTGKTQVMGSQDFRVKAVPSPIAYIGSTIRSGKVTKDQLKGNPFLTAKMENFDFALPWKIVSYKVTVVKNGREVSSVTNGGAQFAPSVQSAINTSTAGTTFEFTEIKASSIAGVKNLDNIAVRIK